jgi:hypothetical protein
MNKDKEIEDIVNHLEWLQIQQSDLLQRLGRLSESDDNNNTPLLPATAREFAVGDRVPRRNPGWSQPVRGTITKIRRSCITVEAHNGTKIVQAPKNLILAIQVVNNHSPKNRGASRQKSHRYHPQWLMDHPHHPRRGGATKGNEMETRQPCKR